MKFLPLLALLISPFVSALTLDDLQQRFTEQPVIRAHFDQTRTIKDLPQPLRSQGQMLIARDQGLLWDQTSPFPMQLLLDDKRMVQVINGQPPQIITAENNPQMFQFNHLLRALFQADRKVLEQNFRVEFADKGEGRWTLRLTPTTTRWIKFSTPSISPGKPIWRAFNLMINRAIAPILLLPNIN